MVGFGFKVAVVTGGKFKTFGLDDDCTILGPRGFEIGLSLSGLDPKVLETLIRKVVREEIRKGVTEAIQEAMNPKTDHKKVMKQGMKNVQPVQEKREFVKDNPMLNDILNETAQTLGNTTETTEQEVSFTSQDAPGFNRSNLASMMGYEDFTPQGQRQSVAQQTAQSMGMSMDDLPDAVSKALTKDYSGLMKKIDEKKNGKEGFRP